MKKKNLSLKKLAIRKDMLTNLVAEQQYTIKGGQTWLNSNCAGCPTGPLCPVYVKTTPEYTCANSINCPESVMPHPCSASIYPPGQTGC